MFSIATLFYSTEASQLFASEVLNRNPKAFIAAVLNTTEKQTINDYLTISELVS